VINLLRINPGKYQTESKGNKIIHNKLQSILPSTTFTKVVRDRYSRLRIKETGKRFGKRLS